MLSYQHEYHAGNHADILKHSCLCMILESLCKKDKPFTVIDLHAGAGIFNLNDERLLKTGEAKEGIEYLKSLTLSSCPEAIALYLQKEFPYLEQGLYAGTPELERLYGRKGDQIHLVEKHPQAIESLRNNMTMPIHVKEGLAKASLMPTIHNEDSYKAAGALTPPLVKRGLIIADPSYEDGEDYKKVTEALKTARRKWNTAIIALWYPLISRRKNETTQMLTELEDFGKLGTTPCESFKVELTVRDPEEMKEEAGPHLYGSGMFIMNPPYQAKEKMEEAADWLESILKN
ncbi:23S rRNA (adenine(2030)-N(6))-methyltransferase RlmJ [Treponema sp.]|uniref:23S rRNA (adenine(2030)-N(6))-methyltransferase RlmJ n=1 Tax=Treponema sp. TaxID=166 RepID=UPI00298EC307|nr:23S rRNA (adenine(2030)-N(6))-methyltransferase RlmJ [Treponema sp.]MCQ2240554.1 23S rRNA (adenine(2030)-N(6))-methyltransferase RlmJ [Treponema sp.]